MNGALSNPWYPGEHRHGARTHLFVVATLCWDACTAPVHIRNLSANGALIEAALLPEPGSLFLLKRGRLKVGGPVAWTAARQAGLAFGSSVSVADWMARQANARQDRIDEIVCAFKSEASCGDRPVSPDSGSDPPHSIEQELSLLRADLIKLGDGLTADVVLVATHPEIQLLDIALQRIDRIVEAMA